MNITPYYANDFLRVYAADCRTGIQAVLADLGLRPEDVDLVHGDPPYGAGEQTDRRRRGRGLEAGGTGKSRNVNGRGRPKARDFPPVIGDDEPFDPSHLLGFRKLVLWGANFYADLLPPSKTWFWWDKREDTPPDDNGDGELAWTNLGGPPRQFRHLWRGTCRASEVGPAPHLGPTQKPIALCAWVYEQAKLRRGDLVVVPYLGTGPDLPACQAKGLRCIAFDIDPYWCEAAVRNRLRTVVQHEPIEELGPLFGRAGGAL